MYQSDLTWNMRIYFSFSFKSFEQFFNTVFIFSDIFWYAKDGSYRYILWRTFSQNIHLKPNIFNVLEKVYHNIIDTFSISEMSDLRRMDHY